MFVVCYVMCVLCDVWWMVSFSLLIVLMVCEEVGVVVVFDDELWFDYDVLVVVMLDGELILFDMVVVELLDDDIFVFLCGVVVGECLYCLFEFSWFMEFELWYKVVFGVLYDWLVEVELVFVVCLLVMMVWFVDDVVYIELVLGMWFVDFDLVKWFDEMGFLFLVLLFDLMVLCWLLVVYGYLDVVLEVGMFVGFIKGFIDMIVEYDGCFWIVDWKLNYFGMMLDVYGLCVFDIVMVDYVYYL